MARGGTRTGSGQKPRNGTSIPVSREPIAPPSDLTEAEAVIWQQLAPLACRMGTLIAETAGGFRLLVETAAELAAARAQITREGRRLPDGLPHPLLVHYRTLVQRTESLMSRYQVIAAGKVAKVPLLEESKPSKWDRIIHGGHDFYGERAVNGGH